MFQETQENWNKGESSNFEKFGYMSFGIFLIVIILMIFL